MVFCTDYDDLTVVYFASESDLFCIFFLFFFLSFFFFHCTSRAEMLSASIGGSALRGVLFK